MSQPGAFDFAVYTAAVTQKEREIAALRARLAEAEDVIRDLRQKLEAQHYRTLMNRARAALGRPSGDADKEER